VQHLTRLIDDTFPSRTCTICYGSKAFPQIKAKRQRPGVDEADSESSDRRNSTFFETLSLAKMVSPMMEKLNAPMIDFIFIVDDPEQWHRQNMSTANYYHYSMWLRLFGSPFVSYIQSLGPGVLYNPFISVQGHQMMIKYGVITTSQLVDDLVYWRSLYVAGRLQKPVLFLNDSVHDRNEPLCAPSDPPMDTVLSDTHSLSQSETLSSSIDLEGAMLLNLDYAVRVSLIMLTATDRLQFTMKELFMSITSLSYCGDNRHSFSMEATDKFEKIVNGSYAAFVELYGDVVQQYIQPLGGEDGAQNEPLYALRDGVDIELLAQRLPANLVSEMMATDGEIMEHLDDRERVEKCVYSALCNIVGSSSWVQTIKGIFSAGFVNSFWYGIRKLSKYWQSVDRGKALPQALPQGCDGVTVEKP